MNYLAHLYLADEAGSAKIGGLLGDFVKGNVRGQYDPEIEIEIYLHRKIDVFTDNHELNKRARKTVGERQRKYAGVLLDVLYDHFLAKNWQDYSPVRLEDFTREAYKLLLEKQVILPEKLREFLPAIIRQDLLASYRELSGFETAINRISRRLKHSEMLLSGIPDLKQNYDFLQTGFREFFPELHQYVKEQRRLMKA